MRWGCDTCKRYFQASNCVWAMSDIDFALISGGDFVHESLSIVKHVLPLFVMLLVAALPVALPAMYTAVSRIFKAFRMHIVSLHFGAGDGAWQS